VLGKPGLRVGGRHCLTGAMLLDIAGDEDTSIGE
jgi:hypothetical protein